MVIAFTSWTYMARIVRGQTLSLREKEFVEASRSMGSSNPRIIFRELLPNLTAPIIVYASILIPQVILYEAALSFLGVGVTDKPSWGQMISDATPSLQRRLVVHALPRRRPAVFTVLAFNLVGDAMQDALNPRRAEARTRTNGNDFSAYQDPTNRERKDDAIQVAHGCSRRGSASRWR